MYVIFFFGDTNGMVVVFSHVFFIYHGTLGCFHPLQGNNLTYPQQNGEKVKLIIDSNILWRYVSFEEGKPYLPCDFEDSGAP